MFESLNVYNLIIPNVPLLLSRVVIAFLTGMVLPLSMFLMHGMIDGIVHGANYALLYAVMLGVLYFTSIVGKHLDSYMSVCMKNKVDIDFGTSLLLRSKEIHYHYYEVNQTYDDFERIQKNYKPSIMGLYQLMLSTIRIAVMLVGIFVYLQQVSMWLTITVVITMLPVLALSVVMSMREYDTFSRYFPFLRKGKYLSGLITERRSINESRLFQYKGFVEKKWEASLRRFHTEQVKANLKPRFIVGFCYMLQYGVVALNLYMIYPDVVLGLISIGAFVAVAQALWGLTGGFQDEIITVLHDGMQFKKFKKDYNTLFGSIREESSSNEKPSLSVFKKIEMYDIWFRYGKDKPFVLKGLNFKLDFGDKIGIVGENGSGKSTLMMILFGQLVPEKGSIILDGQMITDANRFILRDIASVVFQDFVRYELTLAENIALSSSICIMEKRRMSETIESFGHGKEFLKSFNDGLDTRLGKKRWDGKDLSGGQWQFVALTRAIFAKKPLLVLDEPTAALDPMAEVEVYKYVYSSNEIHTLILITHRLGAIVGADKILLISDGVVAEAGTHGELLKLEGLYSQLYAAQKKWYTTISGDTKL